MRIALVVPGFSAHATDWAIPALLNLARRLAATHQLHLFSQRYPARGLYRFDTLTHHATGGGQQYGLASVQIWLQTAQAIIRQHRRTPFDLLHAFWADEAGFSAALAGQLIRRPVVVSLGGGELTRLPQISYGARRFLARRLTVRYALGQARHVTAGSAYQLNLCRSHGVPAQKLHLAPLGVDTEQFQPGPKQNQISGALPQRPALIQAASLIPVKNQTLLLQLVSLVKSEIPDITLHLAGSGPLQNKLHKLAYRLGLSQNINWHGQVPYPDLPRLYRSARLYVQTSHHESQGMAVLEAMACGVPVVGTPVGILPEVACRSATRSATTLATQIVDLLGESNNNQTLRHQARRLVQQRFGLAQTTKNFLEIYTKTVTKS